MRVPFIMRWPGRVPAGAVSNEIVHEMDLFPTLARIVGGTVPDDRVIDGVDQLEFFEGKQEASNREAVIVYVGSELYGVKWRNYKMMSKEIDKAFADPTREYGVPLLLRPPHRPERGASAELAVVLHRVDSMACGAVRFGPRRVAGEGTADPDRNAGPLRAAPWQVIDHLKSRPIDTATSWDTHGTLAPNTVP